jgi:TRAP transporter TAXI family solute receptor
MIGRRLFKCSLIIGLVSILIGGFSVGPGSAADTHYSALCGPVGGSGFSFMSVWAPVINSTLNVNISVQSRGGAAMTTRLISGNIGNFGLSTAALAYEGWMGEAEWADKKKLTDNRTIAVFMPYVFQCYGLAKSNIRKVEDLNGKVVSFNRKGSTTQAWLFQWKDIIGLRPSKVVNVGPGQGSRLIADGRIDAQWTAGTCPHARTQELAASHKIFVIGFGKENVEKILDKYPSVSHYVIKAGTYKGAPTQDLDTIADSMMLICNKNVPDDLVYNIVKTTFEKKKDLVKGFSRFKLVDIENITRSSIPLHPGAVRFYKEKGINLPDKLIP